MIHRFGKDYKLATQMETNVQKVTRKTVTKNVIPLESYITMRMNSEPHIVRVNESVYSFPKDSLPFRL